MKGILLSLAAVCFFWSTVHASAHEIIPPDSLPANGTITGPSAVCLPAVSVGFTVTGSSEPTGYNWSVPDGATITSPAKDRATITVTFTRSGPGQAITVSGNGLNAYIFVDVYAPVPNTGYVYGPAVICPGQKGVTYFLEGVSLMMNTFSWVIPGGATKVSADANGVTVDFSSSFTSGSIIAYGIAGPCGTGPIIEYKVKGSIVLPTAPGSISGAPIVCQGQNGVLYSIPSLPNAEDYLWTLGNGQQQVSVSPAISVNYAPNASSRTLSVIGRNGACGSPSTSMPVTVNVAPVITQTSNAEYTLNSETFTVVATGTALTYQWRKDGAPIAGATSSIYTIPSVSPSDAGIYSALVTNGVGCSLLSGNIPLVIHSVEDQLDKNYMLTRTITKDGVYSESEIPNLTEQNVQMSVSYFDGLGRPTQQLAWRASPLKADVIAPVVYDQFNLTPKKYLPIVSNGGTGWFKEVTFDASGNYTGVSANFYSNNLTGKVAQDGRPFSETVYEMSPLNRPLKDYGPGVDWDINHKNKYTEHQYLVNADGIGPSQERIVAWKVNDSGTLIQNSAVIGTTSGAGYYPNGALSINSTKDEQGKEVREYRDNTGRVILKKVQAIEITTDMNSMQQWAQTYYIYDDLGNLAMVIPPEAVNQWSKQDLKDK